MPGTVYVFGSIHVDPSEARELKPILRRVDRTHGTIAAEFENEPYTVQALKRFRDLNETEINRIVKQEFGRHRVAPYNFLKLSQKYDGIGKMVSIEPRLTPQVKKLSNAISKSFNSFTKYLDYSKAHPYEKGVIENLLHHYLDFELALATQCRFREKHMSPFVVKIAKEGSGDTLLYTGYPHAAAIKRYLHSEGVKYSGRKGAYMHILERQYLYAFDIASSPDPQMLSPSQKMMLLRRILVDSTLEMDSKDITIRQEYIVTKAIKDRIRSVSDFRKAISDLDSLKMSVRGSIPNSNEKRGSH